MPADTRPNILLVLDSAPEEPGAPNLFNAWVADLIRELRRYCRLSIFHPVISTIGPFYRLRRESKEGIERFVTTVPYKYASFSETFRNPAMEELFAAVIGESDFDLCHIVSLRNHSFGYPAIAHGAGLPLTLTVADGWLRCPLRYRRGCADGYSPRDHACDLRLSNFVASPFSFLATSIEEFFKPRRNHWWFEETGRYSVFYNRDPLEQVSREALRQRDALLREMLPYVDRFHFLSEQLHRAWFGDLIPPDRVTVMAQGIPAARVIDSRPFEIHGGVSFGFIGDLIPEEGVGELIEAFNAVRDRGLPNTLHLYGELYHNDDYARWLKKLCHSPAVTFHGAIDNSRIGAILDTIDALILPARWPRPDTWLAAQAMARRKAVIAAEGTAAAELVKKKRRGVVLKETTADDIEQVVADLEIDRKKLYYFMRIAESEQFLSITENVQELLALYLAHMRRPARAEETTLTRRLGRKRVERLRGTA